MFVYCAGADLHSLVNNNTMTQVHQLNKAQAIAGVSIITQTADFVSRNKFIDIFPTSLLTPFANFSPFSE